MVVSVSYRVGIDGFMAIQGGAPNPGIQDQLSALKWVQQNIAAFGGDPGQVTLAGQSAGAQCVLALLGMPQAQGLFQRAIAQSPPVNHLQSADAQRIARATAELLKVEPTRESMSAVPWPALIGATEAMVRDMRDVGKWGRIGGQPPYLPVLDGILLKQAPLAAIRENGSNSVPVLLGCTDDESRLYLVPGGAIDRIPEPPLLGALRSEGLPPSALETYRNAHARGTPGDLFAAVQSDKTFRMPAQRYAETLVGKGSPTWYYEFGSKSPAFGGRLGAAHVVDVPFAFNTLSSAQARPFLGGPGYQPLADAMHAAWGRFIKTGDPGWTRYELARRPTMRFDTVSQVALDPGAAIRQLWTGRTFE